MLTNDDELLESLEKLKATCLNNPHIPRNPFSEADTNILYRALDKGREIVVTCKNPEFDWTRRIGQTTCKKRGDGYRLTFKENKFKRYCRQDTRDFAKFEEFLDFCYNNSISLVFKKH